MLGFAGFLLSSGWHWLCTSAPRSAPGASVHGGDQVWQWSIPSKGKPFPPVMSLPRPLVTTLNIVPGQEGKTVPELIQISTHWIWRWEERSWQQTQKGIILGVLVVFNRVDSTAFQPLRHVFNVFVQPNRQITRYTAKHTTIDCHSCPNSQYFSGVNRELEEAKY